MLRGPKRCAQTSRKPDNVCYVSIVSFFMQGSSTTLAVGAEEPTGPGGPRPQGSLQVSKKSRPGSRLKCFSPLPGPPAQACHKVLPFRAFFKCSSPSLS